MEKVKVLIEALPYIRKFSKKTFVIKYGGSIMNNIQAKKAFIEDVVFLKLLGINVIIIHGGGPDISSLLGKLSIKSEFVNGLRVTDEATMEVVEMVLSGKVNKDLSGELCKQGINALGISGRDCSLMKARKVYSQIDGKEVDLGFVGEVEEINKEFINDLLDRGYLPVISPVAADYSGNIYNINADYAAAAISAALKAEKLILLSDVEGLYKDFNDKSTFISEATCVEIQRYMYEGSITGGMIPKMQCCIQAIQEGTKDVHVIDGRKEHSLLLEVFTDAGSGTMIKGI